MRQSRKQSLAMTRLHLDANHYRSHSQFQQTQADQLIERLSLSAQDCLVDLGCGDGKITAQLARSVAEAVGIDPAAEMIALAKSLYPEQPNLQFIEGDHTALTPQHYDLITAFNCLHWVPDHRTCFNSVKRALRSGGAFAALTYPIESPYWKPFLEILSSSEWRHQPNNTKAWISTDDYERCLIDAGFRLEYFEASEQVAPYPSKQALAVYIKGWAPCLVTLDSNKEAALIDTIVERCWRLFDGQPEQGCSIPYIKLEFIATT